MLADSGHRYHTLNIPYQTNHQNFGSLSQAFHENEKKKNHCCPSKVLMPLLFWMQRSYRMRPRPLHMHNMRAAINNFAASPDIMPTANIFTNPKWISRRIIRDFKSIRIADMHLHFTTFCTRSGIRSRISS